MKIIDNEIRDKLEYKMYEEVREQIHKQLSDEIHRQTCDQVRLRFKLQILQQIKEKYEGK